MNHHPTKLLTTPNGERVEIDINLIPLIEALWGAGYDTIGCCQDLGESLRNYPRRATYWKGYVLLEMPIPDTYRLLDTVSRSRRFRNRMHWAADDAWETAIPVLKTTGSRASMMPWPQIHFPASQLSDLTAVVSGLR